MNQSENKLERIVSLAKQRGFIYQGSEIYGGLAGTWDYGPLGVELARKVKDIWWQQFVRSRADMYGMDASIIMSRKVWEASGHAEGFADPLVECKNCGSRHRVDHLIEDGNNYEAIREEFRKRIERLSDLIEDEIEKIEKAVDAIEDFEMNVTDSLKDKLKNAKNNTEKITLLHKQYELSVKYLGEIPLIYLERYKDCPKCGKSDWDTPSQFNMMFQTQIGASEDTSDQTFLRPETAQGMFVNFKNIVDSFHPDVPFGLGQIGKAFRNEITPRNFTFRTREFEQMEVEYFVRPDAWEESFEMWRKAMWNFIDSIGMDSDKVHEYDVPEGEGAHYAKKTIDFQFEYPFGTEELYGLAYRTDYDLTNHLEASGEKLDYFDQAAGERFVPHVIEPSLGVDRTILALLCSAYEVEEVDGEERTVMRFSKLVAPVTVAVLPLQRKDGLPEKAEEVFKRLQSEFTCQYDKTASIGKRYRRQDEIGTPYCITVDYDTLEDDTVTIRDRDTMEQERVAIDDLIELINKRLSE